MLGGQNVTSHLCAFTRSGVHPRGYNRPWLTSDSTDINSPKGREESASLTNKKTKKVLTNFQTVGNVSYVKGIEVAPSIT